MPFVLPPIEILKSFSEITRPIFDEVKALQRSVITLQQMRDRLLPQLMSGQFDLSC